MSALAFPLPLGTLPTPSVGTFRSMFPEFQTADDVLIQSRLDMAALQLDVKIWGNRIGEGQAYLTAHLICLAPGGMFARLVKDDQTTTYSIRYRELTVMVTALIRIF